MESDARAVIAMESPEAKGMMRWYEKLNSRGLGMNSTAARKKKKEKLF
jgi:hypothetical protein